MATKVEKVVFDGVTSEEYTITKKGVIHSIHGNVIKVTDGRAIMTLNGKRRRVKVADILAETYPTKPKTTPRKKKLTGKASAELVGKALKPKEHVEPKEQTKPKAQSRRKPIKPQAEVKPLHDKKLAAVRDVKKPIHVTKTSNQSFLDVAAELEASGIENHNFMLWLNNPSLEGINPHNPALNKKLKLQIIEEAITNPWYFIRECVRFTDSEGKKQPLTLTRNTAILIYLLLRGESVYYVSNDNDSADKAVIATLAYLMVTEAGSTSNIISDTIDSSNVHVESINKILTNLPLSIRNTVNTIASHNMKRAELTLDNTSRVAVRSSPMNVGAAAAIARGVSANIQWFDNFELINHNSYLLRECTSSFIRASKKFNGTSFRVITSGIGDKKVAQEDFVENVVSNTVLWYDTLLDATWDTHDAVLENSNGLFYIEDNISSEHSRLALFDKAELSSVHEWYYEKEQLTERGLAIYNSFNSSDFKDGVPAIVIEDMEADGIEKTEWNEAMVRAYIIRRIIQILDEAVHIDPTKAYPTQSDTLFANFGTSSVTTVENLVKSNAIVLGRYNNLAFKCLDLVEDIPTLKRIYAAGQYSAESIHLMLNAIK